MAFSMDMAAFDGITKLDPDNCTTVKWMDLKINYPYRVISYEFKEPSTEYKDNDGKPTETCIVQLLNQDGEDVEVYACNVLKKQLRTYSIDLVLRTYLLVSKGRVKPKVGTYHYHCSVLTSLPIADFNTVFTRSTYSQAMHSSLKREADCSMDLFASPSQKVSKFKALGNLLDV